MWWENLDIEQYIQEYLERGKKVFIESGAANDEILDCYYDDGIVMFTTTGSIFPKEISLVDYEVSCNDYNGNLFVQVW